MFRFNRVLFQGSVCGFNGIKYQNGRKLSFNTQLPMKLTNHVSTTTSLINENVSFEEKKGMEDRNMMKNSLEFNETNLIFQTKSTQNLIRAYVVFQLCQRSWLVKNSEYIMKRAYKYLGPGITRSLLKQTFFGHFCAGENGKDIQKVLKDLSNAGIGAILGYAAESDVLEQSQSNLSHDHQDTKNELYGKDVSAEKYCNKNTELARQSILDAGASREPGEPAFAAIKCTALVQPELLMRMTDILVEVKGIFASLFDTELSIDDITLEHKLDYATFTAALKRRGLELVENTLCAEVDKYSNDGYIDYLDWLSMLDPYQLTLGPLAELQQKKLNRIEIELLAKAFDRVDSLASEAAENNVKLLVDAEQTYMQYGIDHLAWHLQRKYNCDNQDVVYNTAQCYLTSTSNRIDLALEASHRENFYFAVKLVRGAYMVQERARAHEFNYTDPVHSTVEDTHANYNTQVAKLLESSIPTSIVVASHNEETVQKTVKRMKDLSIDRRAGGVYFGQLLGMCDHITYTLGHQNYRVFKYVPYGPIDEVVPFLIRRAQENVAILSTDRSIKEIALLRKELLQRLKLRLSMQS